MPQSTVFASGSVSVHCHSDLADDHEHHTNQQYGNTNVSQNRNCHHNSKLVVTYELHRRKKICCYFLHTCQKSIEIAVIHRLYKIK